MPVADYKIYCQMIDRALAGKFAYPDFNVTSMATASAVLKGLAESKSDGIIQVSTGGGQFASGSAVKDMALGAAAIADCVHRVADRYPIYVALHTDHCQADKLDAFVIPLIEETERRRAAGRPNLFNSHMFDGSALPLAENLDIAVKLLERCHRSGIILEIETGAHELLVTAEENVVMGGAGSAVSECLAANNLALRIAHCGLPDRFLEQDTQENQRLASHLDAASLKEKARELLSE